MKILRRWRWPIIDLAILAGFALACQGDPGTGTGGAGTTKACDLRESQPPTFIGGWGKGLIQAKVRAVCDVQPRRHVLRVWLERSAIGNDQFLQVGQTATWQNLADIPPAGGRDYPIQLTCIPGLWRVRASADGIGPDDTPFSFSLPVAELDIAVIHKCGL